MRLDNSIQTAISNLLKNPILSILRDINFSSILKQSNFIKKDIVKSPYMIILHFYLIFPSEIVATISIILVKFIGGV